MKSLPDAVEEYCKQRECAALVIEVRKTPQGFDCQQASDSGDLPAQCSQARVLQAMIVALGATLSYYQDLQQGAPLETKRTEAVHGDYRFAFPDGEILLHATMELDREELAKRLDFMANKVRTEDPVAPREERH